MRFHLGKPILVMLAVAAVSGAARLVYVGGPAAEGPAAATDPAPLRLWLFADSHADAYRRVVPAFERRAGRRVSIHLVPTAALNVRMASLFMSGRTAGELPDAVELDMNAVGQYFRPPLREIGLRPLNGYLESAGAREIPNSSAPGKAGWAARSRADGKIYTFGDGGWAPDPARARPDAWVDRLVANRLAPWSKTGVVFGVPHDVHPVTITYRDDLFRRAGIDLAAPSPGRDHVTWPDFHDRCLRFQTYWRDPSHWAPADGPPHPRHAMELFTSTHDHLTPLLLQRGVNLIDADGRLRLADPVVADTVAFFAGLVAGPRRVAVDSAAGTGPWANDLLAGNTCATLTPDWRAHLLRTYAAGLAGKVRMMPLPRFDPADAPTTTWGGTMIAIPKAAPDPDAAWRLIEFLYFSDQALEARVKESGILPPLRDYWDRPFLHEPDAYFGGQRAMGLYVELADRIPPRVVNWATPVAQAALGYVLNEANDYLRAGRPPAGLPEYVRARLARVERFVRATIEHGTFDE